MNYEPVEVSDLNVAFPTSVDGLLPKYGDVPEEFRRWPGNKWVKIVDQWFYQGLDASVLLPKPGIDKAKAFRHLKVCMGSFEPKHEHKTAGVAYLLSLWFDLDTAKVEV